MTTYLCTKTVDDLHRSAIVHQRIPVKGTAADLMEQFGETHPDYQLTAGKWVRERPYRQADDGTPDHDRTQWDNTTGNLTPHNQDTRPLHPTAANRHYVWYEEHQ